MQEEKNKEEEILTDTGHWEYDGNIPADCFGFVYEITNNIDKKIYIGKKQIQKRIKRQSLKGKKRKRISVVESDWKEYTGSSNDLNNDIAKHGKSSFKFKILKLCSSKSEMTYFETKEQFDRDVLLKENYYNGIINCRIGKIKISA
jgi:hypothetical protein